MKTRAFSVLLLAGGMGERMGALTENCQKCVLELSGTPLLAQIVSNLEEIISVAEDICVGVSYRHKDVIDTLTEHYPNINFKYVWHKTGSESLGAYFSLGLELLNKDFLVVPGDVLVSGSAYYDAISVGQEYSQKVCVSVNSNIDEIDTHYLFNIDDFPYREMGINYLPSSFSKYLRKISENNPKDFYGVKLNDLYPKILKDDMICFNKSNLGWMHIGYPYDLEKRLEHVTYKKRIEMIKNETNPYFVKELETGYVVVGDPQFYRGYSILLCKYPKHELHELEPETRTKFLRDMSILAEAVAIAFKPKKLNYELLGNSEPHMHWHIFPRYDDDPLPTKTIWSLDEKIRNKKISQEEMGEIKQQLLEALNKVLAKNI